MAVGGATQLHLQIPLPRRKGDMIAKYAVGLRIALNNPYGTTIIHVARAELPTWVKVVSTLKLGNEVHILQTNITIQPHQSSADPAAYLDWAARWRASIPQTARVIIGAFDSGLLPFRSRRLLTRLIMFDRREAIGCFPMWSLIITTGEPQTLTSLFDEGKYAYRRGVLVGGEGYTIITPPTRYVETGPLLADLLADQGVSFEGR